MDVNLILKVVVSVFILVLSPFVLSLFKKYIDKVQDDKLRNIILTFVEAADQMLKKVDPTGEQRKEYVLKSLEEMGIKNNAYINALIEQAVLGLWYYQPEQEVGVLEEQAPVKL